MQPISAKHVSGLGVSAVSVFFLDALLTLYTSRGPSHMNIPPIDFPAWNKWGYFTGLAIRKKATIEMSMKSDAGSWSVA